MEIHDKGINISFPNFPSTKQGHKSEQMKTKTSTYLYQDNLSTYLYEPMFNYMCHQLWSLQGPVPWLFH